jgi:hypothetical protein
MDPALIYIAPLFLVTALIYAMIGQGGASAYLAILALFNLQYKDIPPIALACNIVATIGIAYHFVRAGHLKIRLVLPFVITSVPAAFLGGTLDLPENFFKVLLICTLVIVAIRMFFWKRPKGEISHPSIKKAFIVGPLIGIFLGLLAGTIGIGGGVLLMPLIIILKWGKVKEAALAGGLFTLVNSVSGLIGHGTKESFDLQLLIPLVLVVFVGSQIGAHLGAKKISSGAVQKIFAVLLFSVAVRLLVGFI